MFILFYDIFVTKIYEMAKLQKSIDKRNALVQATIGLVNNNGFHATPMSKIAKMANVSPATIYLYFENKQDENTRQGQFFWRTKDDGESKSTRFVVNLNLSSYGDIQLDGLVRTGQFNTKLRLLKSVDEDFVSGLQALYQETLQNLDLAGDIKVELVEDFEIDPLHELLTTDHLRNVEV